MSSTDTTTTDTTETRRAREQRLEHWSSRKAAPETDEAAQAAGYEPGADGYYVGRDPRTMTQDELRAMGLDAMSPMEAIRGKCLDCCAGSPHEVRLCVAISCPNWPFRTGKNPWRSPISDARREMLRERGLALAARKHADAADVDKINGPDAGSVADDVGAV